MGTRTYFVCQPYTRGARGALRPGTAVQTVSAEAARSRAERMLAGGRVVGVDAVQVEADEEAGDYAEPVFLVRLGEVPQVEA